MVEKKELFESGIPILGICYGSQLMGHVLEGQVEKKADHREYGKTDLTVDDSSLLFENVEKESVCWMSHTYYISKPPVDLILLQRRRHVQ